MQEIKVELTNYQKLQKVRNELLSSEIKKTGYNKFQNFYYFELKDFVPQVTKLFDKYGLTPVFNIYVDDATNIEYAVMTIYDGTSTPITFRCPTANPQTKGQDPIQQLGSKVTYMRRYLFQMALDLCESDSVDSRNQKEDIDTTEYATKFQVDTITKNIKLLSVDELKANKIKTPNDIKKLTLDKAEELQSLIEERLRNAKE